MAVTSERAGRNETLCYFAVLLLTPVLLLIAWGSFKIGFENRFCGDDNAGYPGYLAAPPPDLLLIGSSHTRQSYNIPAIESATGRSAYILAYGSLDLNYMDLLLQDLLRQPERRPKIVVLEAYSAKLARQPDVGDYRLFYDAPPRLKFRLMANYLHHHSGISAWMDLFDLVINRGTDQILTAPLNSRILCNLSYKGGYRNKVVQGITEDEFRSLHAEIAGSYPDKAQLAALRDIIELCRRDHIRLVLAESPMPAPISSKPEIQRLKRDFREEAQANHLPYLDGDAAFPTSDPSLFADAGHLSTAGRDRYTANLIANFGPVLREQEIEPTLTGLHPMTSPESEKP